MAGKFVYDSNKQKAKEQWSAKPSMMGKSIHGSEKNTFVNSQLCLTATAKSNNNFELKCGLKHLGFSAYLGSTSQASSWDVFSQRFRPWTAVFGLPGGESAENDNFWAWRFARIHSFSQKWGLNLFHGFTRVSPCLAVYMFLMFSLQYCGRNFHLVAFLFWPGKTSEGRLAEEIGLIQEKIAP